MKIEETILTRFSTLPFILAAIAVTTFLLTQNIQITLFTIPFIAFLSIFFTLSKRSNLCSFKFIIPTLFTFFTFALVFHGIWDTACIAMASCLFIIFFYSLRLLISSEIIALFFIPLVFCFFSFLPIEVSFFMILGLLTIAITAIFLNLKKIKTLLSADIATFKNMPTSDCACWFLIFFSSLALGFTRLGKFFAVEIFHPGYEASIAHSYAKSIFDTPDISYSGKIIKFHFLSPKINYFISKIFNISLLDSVYLLTPFLLTLISFFLITLLFRKHPEAQTPLLFIFFLPIVSIRSIFETLFSRTLIFSPSYFLGFILIAFAIYFLANNYKTLFFVCATMLLLTKASFFVTLGGGVFIYYLLNKNFKQMSLVLGGLGIIFVPLYQIFLAGAHSHIHWTIFPAIIHYPLKHNQLFSALILYVLLAAGSLFIALIRKDSNFLIACASVGISGLLSQLILTETTEQNCSQFLIAAMFPLAVCLWVAIKVWTKNFKPIFQNSLYIAIWTATLVSANYYFYQPIITASKFVFPNTSPKFISTNLIDAYTWLGKNADTESIVLYGKHYEFSSDYWRVGYIRSAVSGLQFYYDYGANKGIPAQPDVAERFVNAVSFYRSLVIHSEISQVALDDVLLRFIKTNTPWSEQQAQTFLKKAKITHIMLENQDQPSEFLKSITTQIYKNQDVTIMKVRSKL